MKCSNCAAIGRSARRIGKPRHRVAAAVTGLGVATLAGTILTIVRFGSFILPMLVGYLVGQSVKRAAHRQSHTPIKVIAAVSTLVGLILGPIVVQLFYGVPLVGGLVPGVVREQAFSLLIAAVFAVISVGR